MTVININGVYCVVSAPGRVLYRSFDEAAAQAWLAARSA